MMNRLQEMLSKLNYLYITRPKSPSDRSYLPQRPITARLFMFMRALFYNAVRSSRGGHCSSLLLKSPTSLLSFAASESAVE